MNDWRASATPLLVEMADHAARVLREDFGLEADVADHAGYCIVRAWAEAVGGAQVYIPTDDSLLRSERDAAIWADFRGDNIAELARRYGITQVHAYRIIKRMRAQAAAGRQAALDI